MLEQLRKEIKNLEKEFVVKGQHIQELKERLHEEEREDQVDHEHIDNLRDLLKTANDTKKAREKRLIELQAQYAAFELSDSIVSRRLKLRNSILGALKLKPGQYNGLIGNMMHLFGMKEESAAFEMLTQMIMTAIEMIFNTPYLAQKDQYKTVLEKQRREWQKGNRVRFVYYGRDDNEYDPNDPDIVYHSDGNGNLLYDQPYPLGESVKNIDRNDLRLNGFVPKPSKKEGSLIVFDNYLKEMHGFEFLTNEQKIRMGYELESPKGKKVGSDKVRDQTIFRQMNMRPKGR